MKVSDLKKFVLAAFTIATVACSSAPKIADVSDPIQKSLEQAGLNNVTVKDDTTKGVVTLGGHVDLEAQKMQADLTAKALSNGQVVANEIAVLPPGDASTTKSINSDLDKGIEKNLDAALTQSRLQKNVKYEVKNGVVKLKGEVDSESRRLVAEKVAAGVPNVQQVVNELQIKNRRATATN
jgi:osmotically-inducible protein OsmY